MHSGEKFLTIVSSAEQHNKAVYRQQCLLRGVAVLLVISICTTVLSLVVALTGHFQVQSLSRQVDEQKKSLEDVEKQLASLRLPLEQSEDEPPTEFFAADARDQGDEVNENVNICRN
jgi:hypothetical protein